MGLNYHILDDEVQEYIDTHLSADVYRTSLSRSPFATVRGPELAAQILAKNKSRRKLPTWFNSPKIYYPPALSIEQCSSELTAKYKSGLATGERLIDLTGGFGVDSLYFARKMSSVMHCELNADLSAMAQHNSGMLGQDNIDFHPGDGLEYLKNEAAVFDTIYIDPARRSGSGKVFMLKDCSPDVGHHLDFLLKKAKRILIKTAPLLDITAGLKELSHVAEIHILSLKNECKELLWVLDSELPAGQAPRIVAVTINETTKQLSFIKGDEDVLPAIADRLNSFLYEPDVALLKTGAFNLITYSYPQLKKLDLQTQLYTSDAFEPAFPGRIFEVVKILTPVELKKQKALKGNVIVRSYPAQAEQLVKKFNIRPDAKRFFLFTRSKTLGNIIIEAMIKQHY